MNIVITGASSGVGYETVLALAAGQYANIVALARSNEKLVRLAENVMNVSPDSNIAIKQFDIVHGDYTDGLLPFLQQRFKHIDILINNAGSLINKPFAELTPMDFAEMLQTNLLGHVKMIQHLLPLMSKGGHIVNIGSMGGFQGSVKFAGLSAYSASKAALHTLTECLAAELAEQQIKVNCLALGSAQTEMLARAFPGYRSPVKAAVMGQFIADFALTGHKTFNGKVLPVSITTP